LIRPSGVSRYLISWLEEQRTHAVIGAFFTVHRALGYGCREYICALALEPELVARRHRVAREVAVRVYYRGEPLARQTLDMLVDDKLVVGDQGG
jgi:GxxExxY protein